MGPKAVVLNCSKSSLFDTLCFQDWFENLFLLYVRKLEGDVVLIGDNLSSHCTSCVLSLAQGHNIKLLSLPSNSTHLMQPLDAAFF